MPPPGTRRPGPPHSRCLPAIPLTSRQLHARAHHGNRPRPNRHHSHRTLPAGRPGRRSRRRHLRQCQDLLDQFRSQCAAKGHNPLTNSALIISCQWDHRAWLDAVVHRDQATRPMNYSLTDIERDAKPYPPPPAQKPMTMGWDLVRLRPGKEHRYHSERQLKPQPGPHRRRPAGPPYCNRFPEIPDLAILPQRSRTHDASTPSAAARRPSA